MGDTEGFRRIDGHKEKNVDNKRMVIYYRGGGRRMRHKDDEKAQRIKEAVIEVVLEEGFGGASISKIAKRAGVSQATVYIYHENKESMLRTIYIECAEELWEYLILATQGLRDGGHIIEALICGYYRFMTEHQKLFRFVEQFSSCPALTHNCSEIASYGKMMGLLQKWQDEAIFKPYHVNNIFSMIFNPVKMLAAEDPACQTESDDLLWELIHIIQTAVLFAP